MTVAMSKCIEEAKKYRWIMSNSKCYEIFCRHHGKRVESMKKDTIIYKMEWILRSAESFCSTESIIEWYDLKKDPELEDIKIPNFKVMFDALSTKVINRYDIINIGQLFYVVEDISDGLINVIPWDTFKDALICANQIKNGKPYDLEDILMSFEEFFSDIVPAYFFIYEDNRPQVIHCENCNRLIKCGNILIDENYGVCSNCELELCSNCADWNDQGDCKFCKGEKVK